MPYSRTTWENSPSTATPLSATLLNNIEQGIVNLDSVISSLTTKGDLLVSGTSGPTKLAVGTNRFALVADSAQTLGVKWNNPYQQQLNAQAGTTYTFALTDAYGTTVQFTSATAVTAEIPLNSSVAFPIGSVVNLIQWAAGTVTVQGAAGVTLVGDGSKFKTNAQYSIASLIKMDTDTWAMFGQVKS